jgi:hypothetical protein
MPKKSTLSRSPKKNSVSSFLIAQFKWFASLDASDQLGVFLMLLSGLGFIIMLARAGVSFNFNLIPVVDATALSSCSPSLPQICEGFQLKSGPTPFSRQSKVIVIPYEPASIEALKSCLAKLDDQRQAPHVLYIPTLPFGFRFNCSSELLASSEYDFGVSSRRICEGWGFSDSIKARSLYSTLQAFGQAVIFVGIIDPQISTLHVLSRPEASKKISRYLEYFSNLRGLSKGECQIPFVASFSTADLDRASHCEVQKMLKDFFWETYHKGYSVTKNATMKRVTTAIQKLTPSKKAMASRSAGILDFLNKVAVSPGRNYAVFVTDLCATTPDLCAEEDKKLWASAFGSKGILGPNTTVLAIDSDA